MALRNFHLKIIENQLSPLLGNFDFFFHPQIDCLTYKIKQHFDKKDSKTKIYFAFRQKLSAMSSLHSVTG